MTNEPIKYNESEIQSDRDLATFNALAAAALHKVTIFEKASAFFSRFTQQPAGADTIVRGIDISKWTVITDAAKAAEGMTFAIIRARDGIRDDSSWVINKSFAQRFPYWGAYGFFNPRFLTNEADGGWRQAEAFWELIKNSDGMNIPPWADCENSPNFTMPPAGRYLHELKYYIDALSQRIGRLPTVYSNLSFFDNYLEAHIDKPGSSYDAEKNKEWLRKCPLAIARPTTAAAPGLPKAWTKWVDWQKVLDNTKHPGLSVCDENIWPGSIAQLDAWCKSDSAPIPVWGEIVTPPPPPPPPVPDPLQVQIDALKVRQDALEQWARGINLK
jgi:GH25 family lysozyme M1 (1,4-beta-N-acetylmuramidase)